MNGHAIAGVIVNCVMVFIVSQQEGLPEVFMLIMGGFAALSVAGAALVASDKKKTGAIMIIAVSVAFVPIGLIGAFGGKKILDELKRAEFGRETGYTPPERTSMPMPTVSGGRGTLGAHVLWLVIAGTAVHVVVNGYFHAMIISGLMQGLIPEQYLVKFLYIWITYVAMVAANIGGIVLLRRNALKTGGYLIAAANAHYIVARTWRMIENHAPMNDYRVYFVVVPSIIALIGGVLALNAAGNIDATPRSDRGTTAKGGRKEQNISGVKKAMLMVSRVVLGACFMITTVSAFENYSRGNTRDGTLKFILAAAMGVLLILPLMLAKKKAEVNDQKNYKMKSGVITIGISAVYALFLIMRIKNSWGTHRFVLSGDGGWGSEHIDLSDGIFFILWLAASGGMYLGVHLLRKARQGGISK